MKNSSRRAFLKSTATAACSLPLAGSAFSALARAASRESAFAASAAPLSLKKGLVLDMVPRTLSYADRFKMARDAGFDVVQAPTTPGRHEAEEMKSAADSAGIRIDSVM